MESVDVTLQALDPCLQSQTMEWIPSVSLALNEKKMAKKYHIRNYLYHLECSQENSIRECMKVTSMIRTGNCCIDILMSLPGKLRLQQWENRLMKMNSVCLHIIQLVIRYCAVPSNECFIALCMFFYNLEFTILWQCALSSLYIDVHYWTDSADYVTHTYI